MTDDILPTAHLAAIAAIAAGPRGIALVLMSDARTVTQVMHLPAPDAAAPDATAPDATAARLAPLLAACEHALVDISGAGSALAAALSRALPGRIIPVQIAAGATARHRRAQLQLPRPLLTATLRQVCARGMIAIEAPEPGRTDLLGELERFSAAVAPPQTPAKYEARQSGRQGESITALGLAVVAWLMPELLQ